MMTDDGFDDENAIVINEWWPDGDVMFDLISLCGRCNDVMIVMTGDG